MKVYLERIDHAAGMARFYAVMVTPTLLGEWAVVHEWGRIGQGGTVRDSAFPSESKAWHAAAEIIRGKVRRGYVQFDVGLRSIDSRSLGTQDLAAVTACPLGGEEEAS